ncbi:MAG: metallophosphoesterase [Fimbriimonadaceae bacterium]
MPKSFEGYKIGLVSDIHYPENIEPGFMGRIGDMIQAAKVDVLCVPGDLADESGRPNLDFRKIFDKWTAPDGQFCTLGNHDHWYGEADVIKQIKDHTPLKLIDNDRVLLERGGDVIVLAGVGDYTDGIVDAERALGRLDPDMPRILMSHNPDLAHDFPDGYRVDLQLSGHTHGGQISFFGYSPIIPSRYGQTFNRGLVQGRQNLVYVTRGVCRWTFHARFCSRPEVSVIELVAAKSDR